jgi:hypothetical protein
MQEFNYNALDAESAMLLRMKEAQRLQNAGRLLIKEGAAQLEEAHARSAMSQSVADGFRASGECDWRYAQIIKRESERLAKAWGATPRLTGNSFFVDETLCGIRTLTTGASVSGAVEFVPTGTPGGSNSLLSWVKVVRPDGERPGNLSVGRFDALPTVTVLATQTSTITEQTPTSSASVLAPSNIGTYITQSRQWVLQTRGGAEAVRRLILTALRTKAMSQLIEGTGTNNEVLGLAVDSNVPGATGTTLTIAHVVAALESVEANAGDGELGWVVTAPAAEILRQRAVISGGEAIMRDNRISGYPVAIVAGTAAHAVFGKFSDLIVMEWTPLELSVNPFANFRADLVGVRGWLSYNAAPLNNASFYAIRSIT